MAYNKKTPAPLFLNDGEMYAFWIAIFMIFLWLLWLGGQLPDFSSLAEAAGWKLVAIIFPASPGDDSVEWKIPILPGMFPNSPSSALPPVPKRPQRNECSTASASETASSSPAAKPPSHAPKSFFDLSGPSFWTFDTGAPDDFLCVPQTFSWNRPNRNERSLPPLRHIAQEEVDGALVWADNWYAQRAALKQDVEDRAAATVAEIRNAVEKEEQVLAARAAKAAAGRLPYYHNDLESFSAALRKNDGLRPVYVPGAYQYEPVYSSGGFDSCDSGGIDQAPAPVFFPPAFVRPPPPPQPADLNSAPTSLAQAPIDAPAPVGFVAPPAAKLPPPVPAAPAAPATTTAPSSWTASMSTGPPMSATNSGEKQETGQKYRNPLPTKTDQAALTTIKGWMDSMQLALKRHNMAKKNADSEQAAWDRLVKSYDGVTFLTNVKRQIGWICEWAVIPGQSVVDSAKLPPSKVASVGLKGQAFDDLVQEIWQGEQITKGHILLTEAREVLDQVKMTLY